MLFVGRHHHQDAVGADAALLEFDGPVDGAFADRHCGDFDLAPIHAGLAHHLAQPTEQFFSVAELRQVARIAEVGEFQTFDAGEDQLLGIVELGVGRDEFLRAAGHRGSRCRQR